MVSENSASDGSLSSMREFGAGLAHRLKDVIGRLGGANKVADAMGSISSMQLRRYMNGDVQPSFELICGLSNLARVDLRWFADGVERPAASVDLGALETAIRDVKGVCAEVGAALSPESEARVIYLAYEWKVRAETPADPGVLRNLVQLAAGAKYP